MPDDALLRTSLLDLAQELERRSIPWILIGGYGLYLKQLHLAEQGERTLIPVDVWPEPRATNDLDLFLRVEVVVDAARMRALRDVLDGLGYAPSPEAKYLQFVRQIGRDRVVKVDLHVGPEVLETDPSLLHIAKPRVRPRGQGIRIHAYLTDDAVFVEEGLVEIPVEGTFSTGQRYGAAVLVPQGFSYLMMKLCAFRDRKDEPERDMGRHHALDAYRIVAMLTEPEYRVATGLSHRHRDHEMVRRVREIVAVDFSSVDAFGVLRLREHPLFADRAAEGLQTFLSVLRELFPPLAR